MLHAPLAYQTQRLPSACAHCCPASPEVHPAQTHWRLVRGPFPPALRAPPRWRLAASSLSEGARPGSGEVAWEGGRPATAALARRKCFLSSGGRLPREEEASSEQGDGPKGGRRGGRHCQPAHKPSACPYLLVRETEAPPVDCPASGLQREMRRGSWMGSRVSGRSRVARSLHCR